MGYICLTRSTGSDTSAGLRLTGMETMGSSTFARMAFDYLSCGNSNEQLILFWRSFAEMCLEAGPHPLQKDALTQYLRGIEPPPPTAAELPSPTAPLLPPSAEAAPPNDSGLAPLADVTAKATPPPGPPPKSTAAKSAPAPKTDPRLRQLGVCD